MTTKPKPEVARLAGELYEVARQTKFCAPWYAVAAHILDRERRRWLALPPGWPKRVAAKAWFPDRKTPKAPQKRRKVSGVQK